jgi:hypothetical protein
VNHVPEYYRPTPATPAAAAAAAAGSSKPADGVAGANSDGDIGRPAVQPAPKLHPGVTRIGGSRVTRIGGGVSSKLGAEASPSEAQPGPHSGASAADAAAARLRQLVAERQTATDPEAAAQSGQPEAGTAPRSATTGTTAASAGAEAAGSPAVGGAAAQTALQLRRKAAPPSATAAGPLGTMAAALDRRAARAHNDAVLAGVPAEAEAAAAASQQGPGSASEGERKRKRGGKESVFGRLKKKLAAAEAHKEPRHSIPGKDMVWIR